MSDEPSDDELSDADTMEPWETVMQLDLDFLRERLTALQQQLGLY